VTNALAVESGLELLGLIGLIDPPRPRLQAAVRDCMAPASPR
jgi:magnesium-transporting ATPase (P-type)